MSAAVSWSLRNGQPLPDAERARRRVSDVDLHALGRGDKSLRRGKRSGRAEAVADAAAGITRMALGEEPERVSIQDYDQLWAGDDYVVPGGYGTLVATYGAGLPVRLSTAVNAIRWDGQRIAAETNGGTIGAQAAIITVPPTVLAAGAIRFIPDLPADMRDALAGLGAGALTKVGLKFDGARFDLPENSDVFEIEDGGATYDFECWTFDRNLVVANFGGDHARRITADGDAATIAATLDAFVRVVGADTRKSFAAGSAHAWHRDSFSLGCYSHCMPGHADARSQARRAHRRTASSLPPKRPAGAHFGAAMTAGGGFPRRAGRVRDVRRGFGRRRPPSPRKTP